MLVSDFELLESLELDELDDESFDFAEASLDELDSFELLWSDAVVVEREPFERLSVL